jgi:hypothetical protein
VSAWLEGVLAALFVLAAVVVLAVLLALNGWMVPG